MTQPLTKAQDILKSALKKIPCELAIAVNGRWMECKECPRCRILHALSEPHWIRAVESEISNMDDDGGIKFDPKASIGA